MKVKTLKKFIDQKEKVIRQPGEVFECTEERYDEIMAKNRLIEPLEESDQEEKKPENTAKDPEPAPKKATRAKKTAK